jgi:hypothetical protein
MRMPKRRAAPCSLRDRSRHVRHNRLISHLIGERRLDREADRPSFLCCEWLMATVQPPDEWPEYRRIDPALGATLRDQTLLILESPVASSKTPTTSRLRAGHAAAACGAN